jgi:hypothetical protein
MIGWVLASSALSLAALGLFGVHGRASAAAAAQAKSKFDRHGARLKDGEQVVIRLFTSNWPTGNVALTGLVQKDFDFPDQWMIILKKDDNPIGVKITGTATKRTTSRKDRDGDDITVQVTPFQDYNYPASSTD